MIQKNLILYFYTIAQRGGGDFATGLQVGEQNPSEAAQGVDTIEDFRITCPFLPSLLKNPRNLYTIDKASSVLEVW